MSLYNHSYRLAEKNMEKCWIKDLAGMCWFQQVKKEGKDGQLWQAVAACCARNCVTVCHQEGQAQQDLGFMVGTGPALTMAWQRFFLGGRWWWSVDIIIFMGLLVNINIDPFGFAALLCSYLKWQFNPYDFTTSFSPRIKYCFITSQSSLCLLLIFNRSPQICISIYSILIYHLYKYCLFA